MLIAVVIAEKQCAGNNVWHFESCGRNPTTMYNRKWKKCRNQSLIMYVEKEDENFEVASDFKAGDGERENGASYRRIISYE